MYAEELAGSRGSARVVLDDDPAAALLAVAKDADVDTLVVGNAGMSDRKKFLLGNIPNRISHNARCNVIIVNTAGEGGEAWPDGTADPSPPATPEEARPLLVGRAAEIGVVMARHGIDELIARRSELDSGHDQAKRLRSALEDLGPTFSKR